MILLLVGDNNFIKGKAKVIKKHSSFIFNDNSKNFHNYKKEYEKYINNEVDVIFTKHHLSFKKDKIIDRDEIYPDWRESEREMKKNIVVLYFKDSVTPNYDLDFICFRLSRLNWLIVNKNISVQDILANLNNFSEESRIKICSNNVQC